MRIMLTGANGQVGWELQRSLLPLGEVVALVRSQCDLSCLDAIPGIVKEIKPDVIINAAAYTAVDKAEEEEALATTINGTAAGVLGEEAKTQNALLVHYSTDYVFDGTKKTPYTENDTPNPINAYGRSKLIGEEAVRQSGCKHLILRTSWVYSARGTNFAKTMLKLAKDRETLNVVSDQIGTPTSAELIADVTALILHQLFIDDSMASHADDTYHLTAYGATNWHAYAQFVIQMAMNASVLLKAGPDKIHPIPTSDFPTPAQRPLNSRLNIDRLQSTFQLTLPNWKQHMLRTMEEILPRKKFKVECYSPS